MIWYEPTAWAELDGAREHGNVDTARTAQKGRDELSITMYHMYREAPWHPSHTDCIALGAGPRLGASSIKVSQPRLAQLHLLKDLVCVCSVVKVLLEEVTAPVREHFLCRQVLLVLVEQGERLVVKA